MESHFRVPVPKVLGSRTRYEIYRESVDPLELLMPVPRVYTYKSDAFR